MWDIIGIVSKGDYDYAIVPDHPKAIKYGYVLLHRVIMENHIGRLLTDLEVVHHMDHNGHNNDISNLELMTEEEHKLHHASLWVSKYVLLQCPTCNSLFYRPVRQTFWIKRKFLYTGCSRSCSTTFGRYLQLHGIDNFAQFKLDINIVGWFTLNQHTGVMLEI